MAVSWSTFIGILRFDAIREVLDHHSRIGTHHELSDANNMTRTPSAAASRFIPLSPAGFHILLALVDEGGGVGAQMLAQLGATAARIREIVDRRPR